MTNTLTEKSSHKGLERYRKKMKRQNRDHTLTLAIKHTVSQSPSILFRIVKVNCQC